LLKTILNRSSLRTFLDTKKHVITFIYFEILADARDSRIDLMVEA
jgi:hypothetical protein